MPDEDLKAKLRRVIEEGWNNGSLAVFDELYAADIVFHRPNKRGWDRERLKAHCAAFRARYPDVHLAIDDLMAAEGDTVVMCLTLAWTDTGGVAASGPAPAGRSISISGIMIDRFEGGRIVEEWEEADVALWQKQLAG
jgi:predicted ester cyclase